MPTLTEDEVRANLPQLIDALRPGDDVVVTRDGMPVARLVAAPVRHPRKAGNCVGLAAIVSNEDIDLSEFEEHME